MADFAGLTNIESIWEIFATPLISIFIIAAFTYFLFGKQYFSGIFQKYKFIKVDGKYYKQKHFSGNKHVFYRNKKEYTLLVPVSKIEEKIINIIQKPVVSISILLLFVYSVFNYKWANIEFCTNLSHKLKSFFEWGAAFYEAVQVCKLFLL